MTCFETAEYIKTTFQIPDTVDEMINEWHFMAEHHYRNNVKLKPGAFSFIDKMKNSGIRMGISTSNSKNLVDIVLQSLNIEEYFDHVTTGDDVSEGKPAPGIYLNTAKKIGLMPENCLVFEDVPMGIMAGKRAGMKVCAVDDPFSEHLKEKKMNLADYYIKDFTEILVNI
jgi:16S rRNA pseudouridine516 synthase